MKLYQVYIDLLNDNSNEDLVVQVEADSASDAQENVLEDISRGGYDSILRDRSFFVWAPREQETISVY